VKIAAVGVLSCLLYRAKPRAVVWLLAVRPNPRLAHQVKRDFVGGPNRWPAAGLEQHLIGRLAADWEAPMGRGRGVGARRARSARDIQPGRAACAAGVG
jgi:hypothetical protein